MKHVIPTTDLQMDYLSKEFFEKHNIEQNKFSSVEEAEAFFKKMGFIVEKEARVDRSALSSMKYFWKSIKFRDFFRLRRAGKTQHTWRLRVA